jgi:superfamily II DNA or RNA helicase
MNNNTNYPDELHTVLSNFNNISVDNDSSYSKNLFDYQKNVFNYMTKTDQRGILLYHSVGSGKCMGIDTPVMMFDGSIKKIQDVNIGDKLMGDDSSERNVLSIARGVDHMYDVWYGKQKYTVNKEHILCLKTGIGKNIMQIQVKDFIKLPEEDKRNFLGFKSKINFPAKKVINSPFLIGALYAVGKINIGDEYLYNTLSIRQEVLAGILSSRGSLIKYKGLDAYSIIISRDKLMKKNVLFLINTLGLFYNLKKYEKIEVKENGNAVNEKYFKITVHGRDLKEIHKQTIFSDIEIKTNLFSTTDGFRIKIKFAYTGNYYGFCIDNNRRYILEDCSVTHNTMTSVSIAEFFKSMGKDILVLSSKSLQINYRKEIHNFRKIQNENTGESTENDGTDKKEDDLENYKFITSNARNMIDKITQSNSKKSEKEGIKNKLEDMLSQINKQSLDDKIIIIDEAHNLFNSISNGSEIANTFYDMVLNAKNIKIILMTGTPVINDPFELAICYNMIVGVMGNNKKKERFTLLPEYYTDFSKYFIAPSRSGILNEDKFKNRIFGLTSYYGDFYTSDSAMSITEDLKKTAVKENYPDRLPVKFEITPMSEIQSTHYLKSRDIEKMENYKAYSGAGISSSDKGKSSTSYRIKSRQTSNIFIDDNTWNYLNESKEISKYSTKIQKMVDNIKEEAKGVGNVLIYSTFLEYGVEAVAKVLDIVGFELYKGGENNNSENTMGNGDESDDENSIVKSSKKKYAIFSGKQTEEEKTDILKVFNSNDNIDGNLIKILMITKSGTEGLDLKNVRYIHITEPYWNYSLLQQVIARGVRYKSHTMLEDKYKNVQVFIYLSDYNKGDLDEIKTKLAEKKKTSTVSKKDLIIEKTTDIHMLTNAVKNQELIYKFLKAIASTSIECRFFNERELNYDCYSCKQTGERLYIEDFYTDMKTKNNCIKVKKVKTKEIIIDSEKYYYNDTKDNISIYKEIKSLSNNGKNSFIEIHDENIKKIIENHIESNTIYKL